MVEIQPLSTLTTGQEALIDSLHTSGALHRRLLDLGFIKHAKIICIGESPLGDPSAFFIHGGMIALRKNDSQNIFVHSVKNSLSTPTDSERSTKLVALAGNPNVGKSTLFNALTGANQHTGNWSGKTVSNAYGICSTCKTTYQIVDLPGTYSFFSYSPEEEAASHFISQENPDATIILCDATCLERSLNLVLQILELTPNVILCVNFMDEALSKDISLDLPLLSKHLKVPVIGIIAKKKKNLFILLKTLDQLISTEKKEPPLHISYPPYIEEALSSLETYFHKHQLPITNPRWHALQLLLKDSNTLETQTWATLYSRQTSTVLATFVSREKEKLYQQGMDDEKLQDVVVTKILTTAKELCHDVIHYKNPNYYEKDKKIDQIFTSKLLGFPIMFFLLIFLFWLTITGANYPSALLSKLFSLGQEQLLLLLQHWNAPMWFSGVFVEGIYQVLSWVIAVMLPPMAIFFPLFTFLEDIGYLPRMAYNLDRPFHCCGSCGKQALTMSMGFGCNACGVVGCRIIQSPRERLLAILTNTFVPCNGRFPTLIAIISMFFITSSNHIFSSIGASMILTFFILLGIGMTFLVTKLLSSTLLKGIPSSYTLDLPPYRKPQIGKIIIRSILDRTLFVLSRAVIVAIPAGVIIWCMANCFIDSQSILSITANFLNPFASFLGLDGTILLAFILGFPANEIVLPIILMAYTCNSSLIDIGNLTTVKTLLLDNGWTTTTALSTMLFTLIHWPCSTTLLTIKKETNSLKWTLLALLLPTVFGILSCILVNQLLQLFT